MKRHLLVPLHAPSKKCSEHSFVSSHQLMSGFPSADAAQVTLANWRTAPYMKWAFQHVQKIVSSADIANSPDNIWRLDSAPEDLSSFSFQRFARFTAETDTDGFVILHRGKVIHEHYANAMTSATPHILMSASKSLTAIVAGISGAEGLTIPRRPCAMCSICASGSISTKTILRPRARDRLISQGNELESACARAIFARSLAI
jgi:hypothetical protein